jgi:hypothetical protein
MSFSAFFHGEAPKEVEEELVAKVREFLSGIEGVASGEFQGEHTGATNLLNPVAAQPTPEVPAAPADPAPVAA